LLELREIHADLTHELEEDVPSAAGRRSRREIGSLGHVRRPHAQ